MLQWHFHDTTKRQPNLETVNLVIPTKFGIGHLETAPLETFVYNVGNVGGAFIFATTLKHSSPYHVASSAKHYYDPIISRED